MVSMNNTWQLLREQLTQIEDIMIPSAPFSKDEKLMRNIINDNHWTEFNMDVLIAEKANNKKGDSISVSELNRSIVVTNILNGDGSIHLFDIILSFNDIDFRDIRKKAAQCIINAYQGKIIQIRVRRLQPSSLETIEFNLKNDDLVNSKKLGFTIDGGVNNENDPGLFIVGIKPKGRAANNKRLRIGDRVIQISNRYVTINLQCIELDAALKLIKHLKNDSTSITLVVAHQTQN
jgi:hypothetical protein